MGCRPANLGSNVVDASQVIPATRSCVLVDEEPPSFILDSRARDEENIVSPSVHSKCMHPSLRLRPESLHHLSPWALNRVRRGWAQPKTP